MKILLNEEMTKEEVLSLPEGTKYAIFNPLTLNYKFQERGSKNQDIASDKHAYEGLIYLKVYVEEDSKDNVSKK